MRNNSPRLGSSPSADEGVDRNSWQEPMTTKTTLAVALSGSATDDDLPIGVVNAIWGQVSGPTSVTFADPTDPLTMVTFTERGEYVLRLTADDLDLTGSDEVMITVVPPNQAPTVNAGPDRQLILPDDTVTLSGSVDDDGLPLGVTVTSSWTANGPGPVNFGDPSLSSTTASFVDPGTYTLTLTGSDTEFTVSDDVVITVFPPNEAPVVTAGSDQTIAIANTTLEGNVTDEVIPAGALEISWSQVSGPGIASFSDATSPTTDVSFDTPGDYVLKLTVFDGDLTGEDEVTITLEPAGPGPEVKITAPSERGTVIAPTGVLGSVQSAQVSLRRCRPGEQNRSERPKLSRKCSQRRTRTSDSVGNRTDGFQRGSRFRR